MASVFLSYDRADADRARPITAALEKAGHSVWWDRHIRGGAQYSQEIEQALTAADAVVVLWSERSVQSAWVRDEAAAGRDNGRLVPVRLDAADAPLGFRQFQTIDLSGWKGRGRPSQLGELLQAIEAIEGTTSPTVRAGMPAQRPKIVLNRRSVTISLLLASLLVAAALIAWRVMDTGARAPTVMVASADESAASKALARDLFVKLGRLQAVDADAIQLVQPSSDREPAFTFQISGSTEGRQSVASVALIGRNDVLLWSKDFERPAEQLSDLRQQVAFTAARVLGCAKEAITSERVKLDQQTLKLYLGGCAAYAELSGTSVRQVQSAIPTFEQVTKRAPEFDGAWAKLLLAEAEVATNSALAERRPREAQLRRHLDAARKLDPRMPEVLQAEILLLPVSAVTRRMELIEKATAVHPDNPSLLSLRSNLLTSVGRMNAAVQAAERAAKIDILSPAAQAAYIYSLGHSGQMELAQNELLKAQAIWPGAASLNEVRFTINYRYGDPTKALEQLRTGSFRSEMPASQESFLNARLNPTRENVARALAVASAMQDQTIRPLIQVFSQFGRERDVIDRLLSYDVNAPEQFTDVLFRPNTRKLRQDARFMLVARRFGLLDYWRSTGNWPDFCSEPDLPYDCKAEAAKVAS